MFNYVEFDIIAVAKRCGVQIKPNQREGIEIKARCPFCGDTKYHLSFNREKERFRCNRCDEHGNSVSLYARIFNVSNKEAFGELSNDIIFRLPANIYVEKKSYTSIRPLMDRHNVYCDFLKMLVLNANHNKNLLKRGFEFHHVQQFMYKSLPMDNALRRKVLDTLSAKHDLYGIPGFYTDDFGDWQMYLKSCGGIFVPICNAKGYIQGLQIRLDDESDQKYRWFSSNHYKDGTKVLPWVHVIGDTSSTTACITEGALKADVTSVLSNGRLFLALPGVNAIDCLIDVLKELKLTKVIEAYDMDKTQNPLVKKALIRLENILEENGIEYVPHVWNPQYKGIDDYYLYKTRCQAA